MQQRNARVRVMVVDDSVVGRRLLADAIAAAPDLEVAGTASSGRLALAKLDALAPDVVTLDVEMPDLDGIETLREIKKRKPFLPVLMCSALTECGTAVTLDALALGAADYITKPSAAVPGAVPAFTASLVAKLQALAQGRRLHRNAAARSQPPAGAVASAPPPLFAPAAAAAARPRPAVARVVAIGVSTGGPNALAELFPRLPAALPVPLLVVQHMPPLFTRLLSERLARLAPFPVTEAVDGEPLLAGHAYLAPGDRHLAVRAGDDPNGPPRLAVTAGPPENSCRPAVDVLFRSVAEIFAANALAVVLTGMGQDGLRGCERIRLAGGQIVVQDEASSVVWGMPGFVAQAGLADEVLPLSEIPGAIARRIRTPRTPAEAPRSGATEGETTTTTTTNKESITCTR